MRNKLMVMALLGIVAVTSACNSSSKALCDDTVITPAGPAPRACVHEVPSGSSIGEDDAGNTIVTLDGSVVATYPPCPCDAGTSLP